MTGRPIEMGNAPSKAGARSASRRQALWPHRYRLSRMEAKEAVIAGKRMAELGRLLSAAQGYEVLTSTGRRLGRVERVRYQRYWLKTASLY